MTLISLDFALLWLVTGILYYAFPLKKRWTVLLGSSLVFYFIGGISTGYFMLLTTVCIWLVALWLDKHNNIQKAYLAAHPELTRDEKKQYRLSVQHKKRLILALGLVVCFGFLVFLKYFNFLSGQAFSILHLFGVKAAAPKINLALPLGISFYTLQATSYIIDVYRGKLAAEKNPAKIALFVCFFPQIIQGPIGRYGALAPQLFEGNRFDPVKFRHGLELALWGVIKKLTIAEYIGLIADNVFDNYTQYTGFVIFLGSVAYGFQVYADFSGGMDIISGIAETFGIEMAVNFERPYFARSIAEFWRRWHITLGAWMRDYVFYPLSLSRGFGKISRWARAHIRGTGGKIFATSLATFIVYLIIGVWHGANFRYIAFGLWNGVLITASLLLEKTFLRWKSALHIDDKSAAWRAFMTLRTGLLVFVGRYFTRAPRLRSVFTLLKTTVLHPQPSQLFDGTLLSFGLAKTDFLVIALGLAVLLTLECFQERGVQIRAALEKKSGFVQWLTVTALLLAVLLLGVFRAGYIPSGFIYTQF